MKIRVTDLAPGWYSASSPIRRLFSLRELPRFRDAIEEHGYWESWELSDKYAEELAVVLSDSGCAVEYV